ncbi:MAG: DNA repair protein RecO [Symploca sp. SIO2E9]|nr:DNA repair protein RecO [Symploca sp. SIO2E9]
MSRTYKATGINLKSLPLGEADRLVTILTREFGLIRVVAPGARKQKSKLGGSSDLFVVNQLMLAKGRSLDKITQAQTLESYRGFRKDLSKLAASQYLAELVLSLGLSEQPQEELYELLNEHLRRLECLPRNAGDREGKTLLLAYLCHGIFHLLAVAGVAPRVQSCCLTQHSLKPDFADPDWLVGFSVEAGGTVNLGINQLVLKANLPRIRAKTAIREHSRGVNLVQKTDSNHSDSPEYTPLRINNKLNAIELAFLQTLGAAELPRLNTLLSNPRGELSGVSAHPQVWVKVERTLREYAQYHCGRLIRSAALLDALYIPQG